MTVDPAMEIEAAKRKELEEQQQQQAGHESEDDEVDEAEANGAGGTCVESVSQCCSLSGFDHLWGILPSPDWVIESFDLDTDCMRFSMSFR